MIDSRFGLKLRLGDPVESGYSPDARSQMLGMDSRRHLFLERVQAHRRNTKLEVQWLDQHHQNGRRANLWFKSHGSGTITLSARLPFTLHAMAPITQLSLLLTHDRTCHTLSTYQAQIGET
jgi:hypothetical protein